MIAKRLKLFAAVLSVVWLAAGLPAVAVAQTDSLPTEFVVLERHPLADLPRTASQPPITSCALRLRHEPSGTILQLRRSRQVLVQPKRRKQGWRRFHSIGYYSVEPVGRFGVTSGKVLKLDCETQKALAVVGAGA